MLLLEGDDGRIDGGLDGGGREVRLDLGAGLSRIDAEAVCIELRDDMQAHELACEVRQRDSCGLDVVDGIDRELPSPVLGEGEGLPAERDVARDGTSCLVVVGKTAGEHHLGDEHGAGEVLDGPHEGGRHVQHSRARFVLIDLVEYGRQIAFHLFKSVCHSNGLLFLFLPVRQVRPPLASRPRARMASADRGPDVSWNRRRKVSCAAPADLPRPAPRRDTRRSP